MKTEIITFHNTSNFGATLQCAALSRFLSEHGFETEVVNYLPPYVTDKIGLKKEMKKISRSKNKVKATLKGIAYLLHAKQLKRRKERFESFIREHLTLSREYTSFGSLCAAPPQADFYICGSDQIWNPALTGGELDEAFFLKFAEGKKIAYGASMGEYDIESHAAELKTLVSDFQALSVREASTAGRLAPAINKSVSTVLDCTLLLNKEAYADFEQPVRTCGKPYLLYYGMQNSSVGDTLAQQISAERNIMIVDISPNPFHLLKGAEKRIDIGPGEFLTLIKNADYVVTNSFHGTVFSILYEKEFVSTLHSTRSGRVVDLLKALGLSERIAVNTDIQNMGPIDYASVRRALAEQRKESFAFLKDNLISD